MTKIEIYKKFQTFFDQKILKIYGVKKFVLFLKIYEKLKNYNFEKK